MVMDTPQTSRSPEIDLLLLHPTGSADPQRASLAIGMLELLRLWFENSSLSVSMWPETAIDAEGHRRFVLREAAWQPAEIRRKLVLVPPAERVLLLNLAAEPVPQLEITIEDRRGDRLTRVEVPIDPSGLFERMPEATRTLIEAVDHTLKPATPAEFFQTADPETAIASIAALERLAAYRAGVGREDPKRLLDPILALLAREPSHPVGRDCLARIATALVDAKKPEAQAAACAALEQWCDLAPISPTPAYFLAIARQHSGAAEPARAAYEEALRRDPLYVPAIQGYAEWLAERGFVDQGVGILQRAFGQTAFEGNLLDQAGCLLANAGRLAEAEPLFARSIASGGPPTAHTNLARSLLVRGRDARGARRPSRGNGRWASRRRTSRSWGRWRKGSGIVASQARAILRGRIAEGSQEEELLAVLVSLSHRDRRPRGGRTARPTPDRSGREDGVRGASATTSSCARGWRISSSAGTPLSSTSPRRTGPRARPSSARSSSLEPGFGRAQFLLGAALERLGRIADALPHLEQAAQTEGDDPGRTRSARPRPRGGGNFGGAAQAHHRAATLAQQDPRILRNAAVSMIRAGYLDEGFGLAHASLAIQPEQPELDQLLREIAAQRAARPAACREVPPLPRNRSQAALRSIRPRAPRPAASGPAARPPT